MADPMPTPIGPIQCDKCTGSLELNPKESAIINNPPPNQGRERGAPIAVKVNAIHKIGNGMVVGARPVCLALEGWYSYCHQFRRSAEFIFCDFLHFDQS